MEGEPKIENTVEKPRNIENLRREILEYQYEYVDRLNKGLIEPVSEKDVYKSKNLGDILKGRTSLGDQLREEYLKRMPDFKDVGRKELRNMQKCFSDLLFSEINFLYAENKDNFRDNWKNKISGIIESKLETLGPIVNSFEDIKKERDRNKKEKSGLISNEIINVDNTDRGYILGAGFKEGDPLINIHFEDLFEQKKENPEVTNIFSIDSLSKLAVNIVEKYPQIKGIVAHSWLVDSAIGKKIGLTVYYKLKVAPEGLEFWGQFIDEKGNIKKEKIQKFIGTGIPEYYTSDGYINTEDFLRKYLPKEKKGLIKLKERSPESIEFKNFLVEASFKIEKNWKETSYEEIVTIINSNPILAFYMTTPDGQEYLELFRKAKELGTSVERIEDKDKEGIIDKWRRYREEKENMFIDKEVLID